MQKKLFVLLGPTGIGKTDLSIEIAQQLNTEIISCDSRQFYREMTIGTAVPTINQLRTIKHHFIQHLSIQTYFNSWQFEVESIDLIHTLHANLNNILMTGGSMLYIDAVCKGIDDIPTITPELRQQVMDEYETNGLEAIKAKLLQLDPLFYTQVDLNNAKRVLHAVEICLMAGVPYSSLRTNGVKDRGFNIIKIGLQREREELYQRINQRVDQMMELGLEEEARTLLPYRQLNALNTVGYKELFDYFDNKSTLNEAIELIKRNSRRYAKKQMTWFRKDESIHWFHPDDKEQIFKFIQSITDK